MDGSTTSGLPLILIELVLVMGGVLAFGIWQIRSTRRDRERMRAQREAERARQAAEEATPQHTDAPPQPAAPAPDPSEPPEGRRADAPR